jgi:cation diffusion facilitator CzcD-associated flavoprotein CzcO
MQATTTTHSAAPGPDAAKLDYDVIVIGAGLCGLYEMHLLDRLGVRATVLEAEGGLGGNWWANRYPGCRFDSESYSYGYSFSPEVLAEWDWKEMFAPQGETLRYIEFVADKYDLRRHVQANSRVESAVWDEVDHTWTLTVQGGRTLRSRYVLTAVGLLTIPTIPDYEGADTFAGPSFHTHDWPHEGIDLAGKRVAVIGTGSSGVQVISTIAAEVAELTVFQRNPNWCAPLNNRPLDAAAMEEIRGRYEEVFARCRETPGAFLHGPDMRKATETPAEERLAFWEQLYADPGFGIWLANYRDTGMEREANEMISAFIADKIRARVDDPATAEKLIPKDHGFGTKRVPLETRYYEAYNRPNVHLVDLKEDPIVRVTPTGIETESGTHEFDVIVYATGFDAVTGAFDRIDFRGVGGLPLRDKWKDGPLTFLGLQTHGFPNLFMLSGPQSGSGSTNFPRGIEEICNWTTTLLAHLRDAGETRVEPTAEAEEGWFEHVKERAERVLLSQTRSWLTGHNVNLDRPDRPRLMIYTGGSVRYRKLITEEAAAGYPSFDRR